MVKVIFTTGTKYACKVDDKGDPIWMQSQKRTIYACNLFQMGPNMLEIIENCFLAIFDQKS